MNVIMGEMYSSRFVCPNIINDWSVKKQCLEAHGCWRFLASLLPRLYRPCHDLTACSCIYLLVNVLNLIPYSICALLSDTSMSSMSYCLLFRIVLLATFVFTFIFKALQYFVCYNADFHCGWQSLVKWSLTTTKNRLQWQKNIFEDKVGLRKIAVL